jgi:hypothetical protein
VCAGNMNVAPPAPAIIAKRNQHLL